MQAAAKRAGFSIGNELLDLMVSAFPDWKSASEQVFSLGSERQDAAAPIGGILRYFYQAATFERLQCSRQGGSIHGKQGGYWPHGWGLGTIHGHQ